MAARPVGPHGYLIELCERAAGKRTPLKRPTGHAGFQNLDYREGINADGSLV
jgi:hypothetical protein